MAVKENPVPIPQRFALTLEEVGDFKCCDDNKKIPN